MSTHIPTKTLSNGMQIPVLGLGTFKEENEEVLVKAVKAAISAGYRHFDCAYCYYNENHIARGIQESIAESNGQLKREDFFIVSKCFNNFHSKERVHVAIDLSLAKFNLEYLDLFLVHWPMGFKEDGDDMQFGPDGKIIGSDIHYIETYQAMEELVANGKVKSIGVSNFNVAQLTEILSICKIKPVCNQVEVHPLHQNTELVDFCQKNDIAVTAYAPLGAPDRMWLKPDEPVLMQNPLILDLAKKHSKSPAQVILRWLVQRGIVVIPKSVTPKRIEENSQIFDFVLSDEDMQVFANNFKEQFRYYAFEICDNHKFYPFEK